MDFIVLIFLVFFFVRRNLSGNELSRVRTGWAPLLPHLQKVDLTGNRISAIEDGAFRDTATLQEM